MKPKNTTNQQDTQNDVTILIDHNANNNDSASNSQDNAYPVPTSVPVQAPEPVQNVATGKSAYPWTDSASNSQDNAYPVPTSVPVQAPEPVQNVATGKSAYPWTDSASNSQDNAYPVPTSVPEQILDEPIIIHPTVPINNSLMNEPQPTQAKPMFSSSIALSQEDEEDSDLYDEIDDSSHKIANTIMIIAIIIAIFLATNLKYHYYVF